MDPYCAPAPAAFSPPAFDAPPNDLSPDPFREGPQPDGTQFAAAGGAVATHNVFIAGNKERFETAIPVFQGADTMRGVVQRFCDLGGQFYVAPLLEAADGKERPTEPFKIHFTENDLLIPICHEGMNRSQILFLALHAVAKTWGLSPCIGLPHGAESGFDPHRAYGAKEELNEDNVYGYIHGVMLPFGSEGEWLHDNFFGTFNAKKQKRVGQHEFERSNTFLNPEDEQVAVPRDAAATRAHFADMARHRLAQRQRMNDILYNADNLRSHRKTRHGKVIIFLFCRAAEIFMSRMLEIRSNVDLRNICIVALPWYDNISRAGGRDEIAEHYARFREHVDRDFLSKRRHVQVFQLYCSVLSAMTPQTAAAARPASFRTPALDGPLPGAEEYAVIMNTAADKAASLGFKGLARLLSGSSVLRLGGCGAEDLLCYFCLPPVLETFQSEVSLAFIGYIKRSAGNKDLAENLRFGLSCFKGEMCKFVRTFPLVHFDINGAPYRFYVLPGASMANVFNFIGNVLNNNPVRLEINGTMYTLDNPSGWPQMTLQKLFLTEGVRVKATPLALNDFSVMRALVVRVDQFVSDCYRLLEEDLEELYNIMEPYVARVQALSTALQTARTFEDLSEVPQARFAPTKAFPNDFVTAAYRRCLQIAGALPDHKLLLAVMKVIYFAFSSPEDATAAAAAGAGHGGRPKRRSRSRSGRRRVAGVKQSRSRSGRRRVAGVKQSRSRSGRRRVTGVRSRSRSGRRRVTGGVRSRSRSGRRYRQ